MSEAETPEAPKRRGRKPGAAKKRHDPAPAPVNGDYQQDVVFGMPAGRRPAWLSTEDVPRFRHRGYVKTARVPGGPRPAWDMGTDSDADFTVGGLTLYDADEETVQRYEAHQRAPSERRMQGIHDTAVASGGYMTRTVER
jgi:hypothetical protein